MASLFDALSQRLTQLWKPRKSPVTPRSFRCQCGRPIFFRNSQCLACGTPLGYETQQAKLIALEAAPPSEAGTERWREFGQAEDASAPFYPGCANSNSPAGCNWLIPDDDGEPEGLCVACRLNRTIPDLSIAENQVLWRHIENAKRRLVSSLLALGLPVRSRTSEDPEQGLAFDFLRQLPGGPPVMTGHAQGIITINVEEADDARREKIRTEMHEPYRTLLGHFRHEVGHYYWDRLIPGTPWHEPCREVFGDEREDYAAALKRHYDNGPAPDWALHHVSAYASTHPWEDWAETWAHYLHMVDTLDTALSFGLEADDVEIEYEPFTKEMLYRPDDTGAADFLSFVNAWSELTGVLNELSRSMGQPDFYPFVLPHEAVRKLQFIHLVVTQAGKGLELPPA